MINEFVVTTLVPDLYKIWKQEEINIWKWGSDHELLTMDVFLKDHGLVTVGLTAAWRWIHDLGFSYDMRKKNFYVDGHERDDVVAYCEEFCLSPTPSLGAGAKRRSPGYGQRQH